MHKKTAIYVLFAMLLCLSVSASGPSYIIAIKDNGQSTVQIELDSNSSYSFELPQDAQLQADGAIYIKNQSIITAYTGTTNKGTIYYTSNKYTVKIKDAWRFEMGFAQMPENITVEMPENAYIRTLSPEPFIYDGSIAFRDADNIAIGFAFDSINNDKDMPAQKQNPFTYILIGLAALILFIIVLWHLSMPANKSAKQNIIKTLPHNERRIINILIENNGKMKRNMLERKSKISKSSLANSLNNLEKKNIIEIDRTFVVHNITLSNWFMGI